MPKPILVCCDRDGTINVDDNYYLGSQEHWRELIKFLPGVVIGIKRLNEAKIPVLITSNQAGVALTGPCPELGLNFDLLTEERMHIVNIYIVQLLRRQGAHISGYQTCPYVDNDYVEKIRNRSWRVNPNFVRDNHEDIKPNTGMIEKVARGLGGGLEDFEVYVIGDRDSDVQMGLNAGGSGILVAGSKTVERGDVEKVRELTKSNSGRVYVAGDFLDAARYIIAQTSS